MLFVFKYFNFFNDTLALAARAWEWRTPSPRSSCCCPSGSRSTRSSRLSYAIEVYRGRQRAERHLGIYALYVMFFPQLVAGPIERPQNLLPQFREEHRFDYARVVAGLQLMAWGLFKKVVVADRLARLVEPRLRRAAAVHAGCRCSSRRSASRSRSTATSPATPTSRIGAARVMGFTLMKNFDRPYLSRSIAEFWRRWHISLSTWFRDYLYIPLGGNRVARPRWYANLFVTFLVSGLWHGARWTFVVWGALHGAYLITR